MTETEKETKGVFCVNCQQPAIRTGNEITCANCDAVFIITEKRGAKVKELGPIEDLNRRVSALEGAGSSEPAPVEPEPAEDDDETEESSLLGQ